MVRRDHHERALEQPGPLEPVEQLAHQPVRVSHLEQVAQVVLLAQVRIVEPDVVVQVGDRVLARRPALMPGRR